MANELPDYSYYDAVLKYLELKYEPYHHNKRAEKPPDNNGGNIDYSYYEAVLKYHEITCELLELQYPELRGNGQNYIKDEKGRFAGSRPGSGSKKGLDNSPKAEYNKTEKEKDLQYLPQARTYSRMIKGTKASNGTVIKNVSCHAARRMDERNVSYNEVKDTLQKAKTTFPSVQHKNATMFRDGKILISLSDNGKVITVIYVED